VEMVPGSIITVNVNTVTGRVDVLYKGRIFEASMRDIQARADLVEDDAEDSGEESHT
jgi:hypothetical protein